MIRENTRGQIVNDLNFDIFTLLYGSIMIVLTVSLFFSFSSCETVWVLTSHSWQIGKRCAEESIMETNVSMSQAHTVITAVTSVCTMMGHKCSFCVFQPAKHAKDTQSGRNTSKSVLFCYSTIITNGD